MIHYVSEWEIEPFTIDGVGVKGSIITSSKRQSEASTGSNGDFEWSIHFVDGSSENQSGDYTVDEEDQEIALENNEGKHIKFDFDLDGDDLELSGTLDAPSKYAYQYDQARNEYRVSLLDIQKH